MSEITKENVKKIAKLAKIGINDEDCEVLQQQLSKTITWIEQLNEVDTKDVTPLFNIHGATLRMEKDEVSDGDITQDVLKNAKNAKYDYFAVPKVIE